MASELSILNEQVGGCVKVELKGDVDIYTSQSLKEKLYGIIDSERLDLTIDCRELNYIDSTGLGIFVGTLKKAKQYDKKIVIVNLKENIKKLFVITGLDKVFVIE